MILGRSRWKRLRGTDSRSSRPTSRNLARRTYTSSLTCHCWRLPVVSFQLSRNRRQPPWMDCQPVPQMRSRWTFEEPSTKELMKRTLQLRLRSLAVGRFLERLRVVSQEPAIKPPTLAGDSPATWYFTYLQDDGSPVPRDLTGNLVGARGATRIQKPGMVYLTENGAWSRTAALDDDFRIEPWESLWLDSSSFLPEIGPAIVLACSAIETRSANALEVLAKQAGEIPLRLWTWMTDRDQYWREPSAKDSVSALMGILGEASLEEETALWDAYLKLREARNRFVHSGVAEIRGQAVTEETARKLISSSRGILDWIEAQLPATDRRPRYGDPPSAGFSRSLGA